MTIAKLERDRDRDNQKTSPRQCDGKRQFCRVGLRLGCAAQSVYRRLQPLQRRVPRFCRRRSVARLSVSGGALARRRAVAILQLRNIRLFDAARPRLIALSADRKCCSRANKSERRFIDVARLATIECKMYKARCAINRRRKMAINSLPIRFDGSSS